MDKENQEMQELYESAKDAVAKLNELLENMPKGKPPNDVSAYRGIL